MPVLKSRFPFIRPYPQLPEKTGLQNEEAYARLLSIKGLRGLDLSIGHTEEWLLNP